MKLSAALPEMGADPARACPPASAKLQARRACPQHVGTSVHSLFGRSLFAAHSGPVELRRQNQIGAVRAKRRNPKSHLAAALGRYAVAAMLLLILVIVWTKPAQANIAGSLAQHALYESEVADRFGADRTAALPTHLLPGQNVKLATLHSITSGNVTMPAGDALAASETYHPPRTDSASSLPDTSASSALANMPMGMNELINLIAILAVIWIALRTERLRKQSDDTGRFRRLHERLDDHSRRLAAHETRLQGLPTHKDLARIDARLVAVEHTMQQIAHSVTRMEDFLINGISATAVEASHDA